MTESCRKMGTRESLFRQHFGSKWRHEDS